jgi:hypothetical protein
MAFSQEYEASAFGSRPVNLVSFSAQFPVVGDGQRATRIRSAGWPWRAGPQAAARRQEDDELVVSGVRCGALASGPSVRPTERKSLLNRKILS